MLLFRGKGATLTQLGTLSFVLHVGVWGGAGFLHRPFPPSVFKRFGQSSFCDVTPPRSQVGHTRKVGARLSSRPRLSLPTHVPMTSAFPKGLASVPQVRCGAACL